MAENDRSITLFGFEIKRKNAAKGDKLPSIVPPRDDDGAGYVTASGTHYGQYLNIDGDDSKDNHQSNETYFDLNNSSSRLGQSDEKYN